jgi:hypothetical protein
MRLDSRHCKRKSAELRGDLVKVEAELGYTEAFVKDEHIEIVVGRVAKVKIIPLNDCLAFAIKAYNTSRITGYRQL